MSFNRLRYDNCAYTHELNESVGTLAYVLDPSKYENCNKCRMELGIIGGTNVSHIKGNLVDLENDLRNQTRAASKCPSLKYKPSSGNSLQLSGNHCNAPRNVDLTPVHLPPCQMIRYPAMPLPPAPNYDHCPAPTLNPAPPCNN